MSEENTNLQKLIDAGILDEDKRVITQPLSEEAIEAINSASEEDIDAIIRLKDHIRSKPQPNIL